MKPSDIIEVAIGGGASPTTVGILRPSFQGGRALASSSFEYTSEYLGSGNAKWRDVAATYGLPASQTDLISQAFDQKQLEIAKSFRAAFRPTTIPVAPPNAGAILVKAHTRNGAAVAEHWRKSR